MFKKYSLKKQFILTFALVIISSIAAVILTILVTLLIINGQNFNPANHYEKMIPKIEGYIKEKNTSLLGNHKDKALNSIIPEEGIKYEVIDLTSNYKYGTLDSNNNETKDTLINHLNTVKVDSNNKVKKYIPILDDEAELKGIVILEYELKITSNTLPKWLLKLVNIISLISPFIFIVLFSYIFGLKFAKNLNDPLNKLKVASKKIENKDLDFHLDYPYDNELGQVITSFNHMKDVLKDTLDKQWALEEERKEIISSLSHDLRSPLTVIKGKVDLLLEGAYKNENRLISYLESIDKSTDRTINLVTDLNTINKLENPEFNITLLENNITDFLQEKLEQLRILTHHKSIKIILNSIDIAKDTLWHFDTEGISRVLDNIITNSIRHINFEGTIYIKVYINENKLYFEIKDTGNGFTESDLKYALKKFYRGDKSRNTSTGNSGLGLYISKIIIEKHHGKLFISNSSSGGALINFYIRGEE